jgi:predicted acylesterase/phospholipase RssA
MSALQYQSFGSASNKRHILDKAWGRMRKRLVTLGLQGGGSHGAFTWGVLDRLL